MPKRAFVPNVWKQLEKKVELDKADAEYESSAHRNYRFPGRKYEGRRSRQTAGAVGNSSCRASAAKGTVNQEVANMIVDQINTIAGQAEAIDQMRTVMKQLAAINKGQQASQKASADNFKSVMGSLLQ